MTLKNLGGNVERNVKKNSYFVIEGEMVEVRKVCWGRGGGLGRRLDGSGAWGWGDGVAGGGKAISVSRNSCGGGGGGGIAGELVQLLTSGVG